MKYPKILRLHDAIIRKTRADSPLAARGGMW